MSYAYGTQLLRGAKRARSSSSPDQTPAVCRRPAALCPEDCSTGGRGGGLQSETARRPEHRASVWDSPRPARLERDPQCSREAWRNRLPVPQPGNFLRGRARGPQPRSLGLLLGWAPLPRLTRAAPHARSGRSRLSDRSGAQGRCRGRRRPPASVPACGAHRARPAEPRRSEDPHTRPRRRGSGPSPSGDAQVAQAQLSGSPQAGRCPLR